MQQSKEMSSEEKALVGGEAMENLGVSPEAEMASETEPTPEPSHEEKLAEFKSSFGRQEKRHKKELRELQNQVAELHSRLSVQNPQQEMGGQPISEDEKIQRAVMHALRAKEDMERQAQEREKLAHVHRQYQALDEHLDGMSGNYEDFDDVVRSNEAPFTEAMRDAALLIPNAGDVLYKLGKNRDELRRISALHPLEQAKEMVKLSVALMGSKGAQGSAPRPIGQIKSSPVSGSGEISERTPISELRRRMKAGWK